MECSYRTKKASHYRPDDDLTLGATGARGDPTSGWPLFHCLTNCKLAGAIVPNIYLYQESYLNPLALLNIEPHTCIDNHAPLDMYSNR